LGTGAGLAMMGERSVCEIQFADYILNSIDLLRLIGNTCWSTRGQFPMPVVVMTPVGAGPHGGIYHSHSIESLLTQLPGWKIAIPSTASDAYGLMLSAVTDGNPVAYLVPKALIFRHSDTLEGEPEDLKQRINAPVKGRERWRPDWPVIRTPPVPLGKLVKRRSGDRLTVLSYGRMARVVDEALDSPRGDALVGRIDLLDLRTLVPLDRDGVLDSLRTTGRLLIVNEDRERTNYGEHVLRIMGEAVELEDARLVAARDLPGVGLAEPLEDYTLPTSERVLATIEDMLLT
jgi:2-oxoisovalerate dehydrogenase E1 component beta subunit